MKPLAGTLQQSLEEMFGPRVTFDDVERMLYSRDMSSLPSLVRPLVGHALAAGVVQPQTEEQGIKLAAFSRIHNVPLVPHGKATSGYGGVVPVKGGLVVDFAWMNQVLAIDPEARTATVQPGVVWQKLEQALNKLGRKPR